MTTFIQAYTDTMQEVATDDGPAIALLNTAHISSIEQHRHAPECKITLINGDFYFAPRTLEQIHREVAELEAGL